MTIVDPFGGWGDPEDSSAVRRPLSELPQWPHPPANPATWVPWPGFQQRFLSSSAYECLGGGAAGPGKTDVLLLLWLRFADRPWMRVLLMRRTAPELQEMMDRAARYYRPFGARWVGSRHRWEFPAGGWIRMGYADRREMLERHMGFEYSGVGWDELGQVPREDWWTRIISRIRSTDPEAQQYLWARATANPGGAGHAWVRRRFLGPCGRDGATIYVSPDTGETREYCPGTIADNPSIDPAYVRRLNDLPERERRALRDGDWDAAEGLAYEELDAAVHQRKPLTTIPPHWHLWGTFDWGYAHYAVFILWGIDETGLWHVIDAHWMRRMQPSRIGEYVAERVPLDRLTVVYASPDCWAEARARAEPDQPVVTIATRLQEAGWPVQRAYTDRVQRLAAGREMLAVRGRGPDGTDCDPQIVFHMTAGVQRVWHQLETAVTDPDKPNTVLKVDIAPGDTEGGDDGADAWSFGPASYQAAPPAPEGVGAYLGGPHLSATMEQLVRHTSPLTDGSGADTIRSSPGVVDNTWEVL